MLGLHIKFTTIQPTPPHPTPQREEVQKWKEKAEREEKLRVEAEGQVDTLQEEKRRLEEQLRAENDALREAASIRERLNSQKGAFCVVCAICIYLLNFI